MNEHLKKLIDEFRKDYPHVYLENVFQGYIQELDETLAYVQLQHFFNEQAYEAEIPRSSFPLDYPLSSGVIFYLYTGYEPDGEKQKNFNLIRLNQEVWTLEMIHKAQKQAEKLINKLNIC